MNKVKYLKYFIIHFLKIDFIDLNYLCVFIFNLKVLISLALLSVAAAAPQFGGGFNNGFGGGFRPGVVGLRPVGGFGGLGGLGGFGGFGKYKFNYCIIMFLLY
jgi:hypothetical protein